MEWFTESLRTLNLDNLIMKTTDAPTEGEQPMPPYRRRVDYAVTTKDIFSSSGRRTLSDGFADAYRDEAR